MRDGTRRTPGAVADDVGLAEAGTGSDSVGVDVRWGADTDADGRPDTLLTVDGTDLLVLTDLDDDGLADRVLRLGPDGSVSPDGTLAAAAAHPPDPPDPAPPHEGGAPAHGLFGTLLGRLLGPGA